MEACEKTVLREISVTVSNEDRMMRARAKDTRYLETSWALDVHEKGPWIRDDLLELVSPGDGLLGRVEDVDGESLEKSQ